MTVVVVTLTHGRHEHLRRQHEALAASDTAPDGYVVVAMDDAWVPTWRPAQPPAPHVVTLPGTADGLPLAAARNLGAATARTLGAHVLVFLDVDCLPGAGLVAGYRDAVLAAPDRLHCGPVTYLPPSQDGYDVHQLDLLDDPHPGRPAPAPGSTQLDPGGHDLFWSLSFALTPATWDRVGGFDSGYVGYGAEDTDFGRRARQRGVAMSWVGSARAYHQHHPVSRPPVEHVAAIVRNGGRFAQRWGQWPMRDWLDGFVGRGLVVRDDDGGYRLPG